MRKDDGSMLLSVLLFVSFSAFLIISGVTIVRNHSYQLRQTQASYETKSMIEMTHTLLQKEWDQNDEIQYGEVIFSDGKVEVNKVNESTFQITATLNRGFEASKRIQLDRSKQSLKEPVDIEKEEKRE